MNNMAIAMAKRLKIGLRLREKFRKIKHINRRGAYE
jgi:hypothetical protein